MGWFAFITGTWSKAPAQPCGSELTTVPARTKACAQVVSEEERMEPCCAARSDTPRLSQLRPPPLKTKQAGDSGSSARKESLRCGAQ